MVTDWRSLARIEDGRVLLDHNKLNIFDVSKTSYEGWTPPKVALAPYESLVIGEIDIETTGLDPKTCQIIMIGIWIHDGDFNLDKTIVIKPDVNLPHDEFLELNAEKMMLMQLSQVINKYKVDVLSAHNGYNFDYPFITYRLNYHNIPHNFYVDTSWLTVLRNTSHNGKPLEFHQVKHSSLQLVDTYCLAAQDDFVNRNLNSYSLKSIPVEWGMRFKSDRVELTNDQIQQCWKERNFDLLQSYLVDDLRDLELLTSKLLPNYYYQKELLPKLSLQQLVTFGNATKWNILLVNEYGRGTCQPDPKLKFEGSYTAGKPGLFEYVSKCDVSSLYPFIMLTYDVYSRKDIRRLKLRILHYLRKQRFELKTLKKSSDPKVVNTAKNRDTTAKVFLNSAYGDLGVTFKDFNDMVAAAAVTAYGRALAHYIEDTLVKLGANVIEVDTDGFIYCAGSHAANKAIHEAILPLLPEGLQTPEMFEYEWQRRAIWIPANSINPEEGQKKNYIMFNDDFTYKAKGRFVKRDRSVLERTFQADVIAAYLQSPKLAYEFVQKVQREIATGKYPVEKLQITRLVKKSEVKMPLLGFEQGEKHTFWYYKNGEIGVKKKKPNYEPTNKERYSSIYYLDIIDSLIEELPNEVKAVCKVTLGV